MPQSLTATISVSGVSANSGVVTFLSNGSSVGTGSVNGAGVATLSLSTLPTGSSTITATFGGTSNLAPSASSAVTVTVSPDSTTTTLSSSTTTPLFGSSVTLTASVGVSGVPATSGVVTFLSNGSSVGTGIVNGVGVATLSLSTLPAGSDTITATFGGTSNLAASASIAVMVTISPDITTTTLNASSNSSTYGSSVNFTATVSSGGSPATSGVVTFLSSGLPVATGLVNGSGIATTDLASLPVGTGSITASYGGTSDLASSVSNAVLVTVNPNVTLTVLSFSSPILEYGSNVTATAAVTSSNNPVTSGTVSFLNNGLPVGSATIKNGLAAISLTSLPVGLNSITASFTGTLDFAASTSSAVIVTVSPDQTTTTLSASSTNPAFGSSVIMTAVAANGSIPVTNGAVTFFNGGSTIGTGLTINGVAMLNLTTLPVGANSITASFLGTSTLSPSASAPVMVSVSPDTTTTALTVSSETAVYGSSVTFTAAVAHGSSQAGSGLVTFLDGSSVIGTGTVINGVATLSLTTLPLGADQVSANFAGTSNLAASASNTVLVTVTSAQASTATTLASSMTAPTSGASVTLTATVLSNGTPVPSGTINFLNGGTSIGTGAVVKGVAVLHITSLPVGANSISASFGAMSNFAASTSNAVVVTVVVPVPSTPPAVTVAAPPSATPGSVVVAAATFSAGTSYSGMMILTCKLTGSPAGAQSVPTCSMNPSTVSLAANGVGSSVLSIQTIAASTTAHARTSGFSLWGLAGRGTALAGLFMFCVPLRRRRLLSALALVIFFATVGFTGCAAGTGSPAPTPTPTVTPSTTAGTYAFTISGTDALNPGITASTVVSVTVQ